MATIKSTQAGYSAAKPATVAQALTDINVLKQTNIYVADTASNIAANLSTLSGHTSGIVVNDTGLNISKNLDLLQQGHSIVTAINVTSGTVNVTVSQLTKDASILNEISSTIPVILTDSAQNIQSNLSAINSFVSATNLDFSIAPNDRPLVLTADQVVANPFIASSVSSPSMLNMQLSQDFLNQDAANPSLGLLTSFDGLTQFAGTVQAVGPTGSALITGQSLNFTASQATNESGLLSEIPSSAVTIRDTAANITQKIDDLQSVASHIGSIQVSDPADPISLTIKQLTADPSIVSLLHGDNIAISDSGVNIQSQWATLESFASQITSITDSSGLPTLPTMSVNDLQTYQNLIPKLTQQLVVVSDTGSDVAANIGTLNANIAHIDSIVAKGDVVLSASQVVNNANVLNHIVTNTGSLDAPAYTPAGVVVSDTALNISSSLNSLQGVHSSIANISLTDSGTVQFTAAQITSDTDIFKTLTSNGHPVGVTDTAANITGTTLDALNSKASSIQSITVSNNQALSLSATQFTSDTNILNLVHNANGTPYSATLTDTAANINQKLTSLENNLSHIKSISVSDVSSTHVVTLGDTDIQSGIFEKIITNGSVVVNSSNANQLQLDFSHLASNAAAIKDISLVDHSASLSITAAQFTNGGDAILKMLAAKSQLPVSMSVVDTNGVAHNLNAYEINNNILPCYVFGTHIETELGPKLVQDLKVGDLVLTVDGRLEPVIWIGSRRVLPSMQANKDKSYPVRIIKDAFGDSLPKRDLLVSPDHSVYIDGCMIPAEKLINGKTIIQEKWSQVTYFHVELPKHEAIYAEGLPAESYLDTTETNRAFFNQSQGDAKVFNASEEMPTPKDVPLWRHIWDTQGYGKLVTSGTELDAIKAKLNARAEEISVMPIAKAA